MRSLLLIALIALSSRAHAFEPTDSYTRTQLEGFQVLLSSELEKHPEEKKAAIEELASQIRDIRKMLPREAYFRLQHVPIWMEWRYKENGAAEYHPSALWLRRNGYNPSKAKAVEINNAVNFVKWSNSSQPSMLLHELAHAWHHLVITHEDKEVLEAFEAATKSGGYDQVKHVKGRTVRAYALTNDKEYFAEVTEAYYGKNDMFPFTREELKKHDPKGFEAVEKAWAQKPSRP